MREEIEQDDLIGAVREDPRYRSGGQLRQTSETIVRGRRPNVLLIGAPRCASTSLALALDRHPAIFLCKPKEPHFLALNGRDRPFTGLGAASFSADAAPSYSEWLHLYEGRDERYLLDASVSTMSYPETAIPNIRAECAPDTKLIVILRNPVDRTFSSYQYARSKGWDGGSFEDCLAAEETRMEEGWQHLWALTALSRYENSLRPFLETFGRDRLHVVITEELSARPGPVMRGVFDFLDIPDDSGVAVRRMNSGGLPKRGLIGSLAAQVRRRPRLKRRLASLVPDAWTDMLRAKSLVRSEMKPRTRTRLVAELSGTKPWVEALIGRGLPMWD